MSYQWKPGMKAVCITRNWWRMNNYRFHQRWWYVATGKRPRSHGPAYEEMVSVVNVVLTDVGLCLVLAGYEAHGAYSAVEFRPMDALADQLEMLEKEGCPTSLPEPVLV